MLSMSLQAADFDNQAVANATNPSLHSYHHGPIPNKNVAFVDPARAAAIVAGVRPLANVKTCSKHCCPNCWSRHERS